MNNNTYVAVLLGTVLAIPVWADTLISAGETLTVTNTEDLGFSSIQMGTGATLAFVGASAASAGMNEYTRTGTSSMGTPGLSSYGTWTRITSDAYWASANITEATTEYIYTGRWHIPAAGLYGVFEHIDDAALIAIDGRAVLQNTSYNTPTCVRDIALTAGWHDLELRLFNGAAGGGIANATLASGILFSPSNDFISVANQTNAYPFADTGDGSSLRTVHNGTLMQKIFVDGEATFDLTQQDLEAPLSMIAGLLPSYTATSAKVTVAGGTGEILFGTPNQGVHFTPFNADIAFTGVDDPGGVTFRDYATVIAWPTSCVWRVADNATVALFGTNMLGSGDVTLTNHNIYVLSPYAVANDATIHVQGINLAVFIKPCTIDTNGYWSGSAAVLTNNISLEGSGSKALFPDNVDLYLQGSITGTGTVTKSGVARTQIKEPCDFVGNVACYDGGPFVFESGTAGHSNNTVTVGANATFALYPSGYGTSDTTAWIKTLHGAGTTNKLLLPAKQTMTIDYLDGTLTVEGTGAALRVNTLGTNAVLSVIGQTAVLLANAAPGATLSLTGPGTSLTVTAADVVLETLNLATGKVTVNGAFTISQLTGAGTLVKQGTETLRVNFCTNSTPLRIDEGKIILAPPDETDVLGDHPMLWLDASADNVFTQYKAYTYTNGFLVISNWFDCRPGAPVYAYNDRGEDNCQVYPYVMTNNQNGLSVVSMGSFQKTLPSPYGGSTGLETRRIYFSANIAPQYAVMMFGSQEGGGVAMLGGNSAFLRAGSTTDDYRNPATPILASGTYQVWTNGVAVTATNTGYTGGYQILTVYTKGQSINSLGWRDIPQTAGGQNYGEVLLYTNVLTTIQRMTAEAYLAKKWRLPYAATAIPTASVAAGAALEIGGSFSVGLLDGDGNVIVSDGAAFEAAGLFLGTITLGNGRLTVSDLPPPPQAEALPMNALTGWFDPNQTNRVVFGGAYTPTRPLTIAALYDRTTTSRFLLGTFTTDLNNDRRPWLSATNGPLGKTLYWIDYTNIYSGDLNGNTLRLYNNTAYIGTADTSHLTPTNVQSGFIVLDSSRGGGGFPSHATSAPRRSSLETRNRPPRRSGEPQPPAPSRAAKPSSTALRSTAQPTAITAQPSCFRLLPPMLSKPPSSAFTAATVHRPEP